MSNNLKDGISNSMECLHASEKTYEEVMSMVEKSTRTRQPRGAWSWAKVAAVALAAILVIGSGAYAVSSGVFQNFTNILGTRGQSDREPIADDNGMVHARGIQWFDTSGEAAIALLGDKVQHVDQTIEHDGYVLTVHDFVADTNGVMIAWATLSNENGLGNIVEPGDGYMLNHAFLGVSPETSFRGVYMIDPNGEREEYNHTDVVNLETASDTSIELALYCVARDCKTPESVAFRMNFEDAPFETEAIPVNTPVEAKSFDTNKGWIIDVSPLSVVVHRGLSDIRNLTLTENDGTELTIMDDNYYNVIIDFASNTDAFFVPTMLMNPDDIAGVTVDGDYFEDPYIYSDDFVDPEVLRQNQG